MKQIFTFILLLNALWVSAQLDCFANATQISCTTNYIDANENSGTYIITGGYCGSNISGYTGPEKTYRFTLTQTSTISLKIADLTDDLDLFLLRSSQVSDCIASSTQPASVTTEFISVTLEPGTYYVMVDGWNGAISKYNLSMTCSPNTGQIVCTNAKTLECNKTLTDSTTLGVNNSVGPYCSNYSNYIGKEKVYQFNVSTISRVQLSLKGFTNNQDIFLLSECNRVKCLASSTKTGLFPEDITMTLPEGKYYVVVDGFSSSTTKYQLTMNCTPLNTSNTLDCENAIAVNYSGNGSDLKFNYVFSGGTYHRFIQWRYNTTILSTNPNVNLLFQGAGTYNICADYEDMTTGQIKSCCKQSCISLPNNCETLIQYQYTNGVYVLSLSGSTSQYQNITWRNDTDGVPLDPNNVPANCRNITVTVSYFNTSSNCWTLCCRNVNLCPPSGCENNISFNYVASSNVYQFTFSNPYATNLSWKFEETNTSLPYGQFYVPSNWTCQDRTVSVYYKDTSTNCWRVCSKRVTICPPINCQTAISYQYNSSTNKFVFTLANSYGGAVLWKFEETNTILPNGEFYVPSNWTCRNLTVSVYYFDISSQCYRVCSKIVTICPPVNCETAIQYAYIEAGNKYQFTLNVQGAQSATWYFEEGSVSLPNGYFYLPSNWVCQEKTIVVHYFDSFSQCWRVCSRRITICPPITCENAIDYTFNAATNSYHFSLNIPGASSISWQFDDNHTQIPNGEFVLPAGWTCQSRPVSVYYYYPGSNCWRVCCKWVEICPPTNCNNVIDYKYNPDGDAIVLSYTGSDVSQLTWTNETTGTTIGSVGQTQVVYSLTGFSCATHTFSIKYYENGVWHMCCKNIYVCNPNQCAGTISSTTSGNVITLSIPSNYTDVRWIDPNTSNVLGTGNTIQIPLVNGSYSGLVSVNYYDPAQYHYKTCSKLVQASCPKPVPSFTFNVSGDLVFFTNTTTNANSYSWNFNGGLPVSGSTHETTNPTASFSQGTYNVCLTATNTCGSAQICHSIEITKGHDCSFYIPETTCGMVGTDVIIPVRVADFDDVLTCNFTIRNNNVSKVHFKAIEQVNPAIQSGYNQFIADDHIRFLWSSPTGKTLDDDATLFFIRASIKEESTVPVNVFFSDDPVKIEAFNASMQRLNVQTSSGNICIDPIPSMLLVSGNLETHHNKRPIINTEVHVSGDMQDSVKSNVSGDYSIGNVTYHSDVQVFPFKDNDPYNGINALDIVVLQRHVLQVQPITDPYYLIAGDVNRDGLVNGLDIVAMQQMQLRMIESFPNNTSWRFIPKSFTFTTTNPLTEAFPEAVSISQIASNVQNLDFYGIKVGDMNETNDAGASSFGDDPHTRITSDSLKLYPAQIYATPDGVVHMPIKAHQFEGLTSMEGSIHFDPATLKFTGISHFGLPSLGTDNFARPMKYGDDVITFTWADGSIDGIDIVEGNSLFTLEFEVIGQVGNFASVVFNDYPLPMLSSDETLKEIHIDAQPLHVDILSPLELSPEIRPSNCYGENDGLINPNVSGGTGQFSYAWSNGSTNAHISGLADGNYQLTVTDLIAGLSIQHDFNVVSPSKIEGNLTYNPSTHTLEILGQGGTAPYAFIWNTGQKASEITITENGLYSVVIVDSRLCVSQKYEIVVDDFISATSDFSSDFKIYPNPAYDKITIKSSKDLLGVDYSLLGINGNVALEGKFEHDAVVDLSEINSGVYILYLKKYNLHQKIVVRK